MRITNTNYDSSDGTGDGSNKQPSYVGQIQVDGTDGSSAEDRIIKRIDEWENERSKDGSS